MEGKKRRIRHAAGAIVPKLIRPDGDDIISFRCVKHETVVKYH